MIPALTRLPPSVIALLLQVFAFALSISVWRLFALSPSPLLFAACCGALAATFSKLAGMARWWIYIQFTFVPALVLVLALDIPPVFFLAAFLVMLVVYWSTFRTQVPLYLSSEKVWQALATRLPATGAFRLVDLGSGMGGVLTYLARANPLGHYLGVETAPLPFFWSWLRIKSGGFGNCEVRWGSLWECDLSQFDVVFAYLSPVPMEDLWNKAKREMRPGSLFISNTFTVPGHPPQETLNIDDMDRSALYLWRM